MIINTVKPSTRPKPAPLPLCPQKNPTWKALGSNSVTTGYFTTMLWNDDL